MLINDDTGALAAEDKPGRAHDSSERRESALTLPWLFPWLLAVTGILITLVLIR
jgi:hypothetical protein